MKNCKWLTIAILAVVQTLTACSRDVTEVQEFSMKGLPGTQDARLNAPGTRRLDAIPSNLNLCDAGDAVRDAAGKFLYWNSNRKQVDPSYTAADSVTSFYRAMRFDGTGKQTQDLQCVLKAGVAAEATLRALTANTSPLRAGWARVEEGTWCYIYTNVVECGSVSCVSGTVLRAGARAVTAADSFELVKTGPRSVEGKGWFCSDGDYLIEHTNWFEIIKPGQPGYNGCEPGTHWEVGGCVENPCDPTQPGMRRCVFALGDSNVTLIANALGQVRPDNEFTADSIRVMCHDVRAQLSMMWGASPRQVQEGQNIEKDGHDAATEGSVAHVDQNYLNYVRADPANRGAALLALLLHEAAHVIGQYDHDDGIPASQYPYPYNFLSNSNSQNSCAKSVY